jgi:hypothetical protein
MPEEDNKLYVIESDKELTGPILFYLGARSGNYYYVMFAKNTIEAGDVLGRFNSDSEPKVVRYMHLKLEKIVAKSGLFKGITLQDLLINTALAAD